MIDMTRGNANKLILKFALPMILGNIFQQVYNLVDTIIVGKFVGADALAAVGSSFAIVVFNRINHGSWSYSCSILWGKGNGKV